MTKNFLTNSELVVNSYESASCLMRELTENGYVVMLSREDDLYIISYIWTSDSDRNEVCFIDRPSAEEMFSDEQGDYHFDCGECYNARD